MSKPFAIARRVIAGLAIACASAAWAQPPDQPSPATAGRRVGGHVGVAVPMVSVNSDDTTSFVDDFVVAMPIGIGLKLTDRLVLDFETIVQNPVDPSGTTGFVVDPGLVYDFGPFAAGLRLAMAVNAPSNVGLIPLVNKGIMSLGGGTTWFVEAAFPTFVRSQAPDVTFDVVLHTGIGF